MMTESEIRQPAADHLDRKTPYRNGPSRRSTNQTTTAIWAGANIAAKMNSPTMWLPQEFPDPPAGVGWGATYNEGVGVFGVKGIHRAGFRFGGKENSSALVMPGSLLPPSQKKASGGRVQTPARRPP